MKTIINGKPRQSCVKVAELRKAINYYMDILIPNNEPLLSNVTVIIQLIGDLQEKEQSMGFCSWLECPVRPKKFLIELDSNHVRKNTLITLAHETVHVMQMLTNRWQTSHDVKTNWWMGTPVDITTVDYYDLPWEIDAHGREYGLYHRFISRDDPKIQSDEALLDKARMIIPVSMFTKS